MSGTKTDHRLPIPAYGAFLLWENGTPRLCYLSLAALCVYDEDGRFVHRHMIYLYNLTESKNAELRERKSALEKWGYRAEIVTPEVARQRLDPCYRTNIPADPQAFWRENKRKRASLPARKSSVGTRDSQPNAGIRVQGGGPQLYQ